MPVVNDLKGRIMKRTVAATWSSWLLMRYVVPTVATVFMLAASAQAQSRGTTASGAFGQTTLGNPQGTSAPTGTGMTTGAGGNTGQGGATAQPGTEIQSSLVTGQQNLQRGGQTGFVGSSQATVQNPFSTGQGGRGNQNFSQLTQLMTQSRQNQFNRQQAQKSSRSNTQAKSQFRVPLRLGFQPTPVSATRFNGQLSSRLTKIEGLSKVGPIRATLEGQTAVLRGTVATEADRQLAEGLARLEPEVQAVRNELVVAAPGTTVEALPQTSP
jgi:BON domain